MAGNKNGSPAPRNKKRVPVQVKNPMTGEPVLTKRQQAEQAADQAVNSMSMEELLAGIPADQMPPLDGNWGELEDLYQECSAVSTSPALAVQLMRDKVALAKLENLQSLKDTAQVLTKDVIEYNQRLQAIHAKHAGKVGAPTDPNEYMEMLAIGEDYASWLHSYQLVVLPNTRTITEMFQQAPQPTPVAPE